MPPTPTPTPTPTPPPPPTYPYTGTDCDSTPVTIHTSGSSFSSGDIAYGDSFLTVPYSGYFVYNGIAYSYFSGTSSQYSYSYSGTDCGGGAVTIYTSGSSFSISDTAYANACKTSSYTGTFIYNGLGYSYSSGAGSQYPYPYTGTDCGGLSVTIYTSYSPFSSGNTAYTNTCSTGPYTGTFVYNGSIYSYSSGVGSQYSYSYSGTDCDSTPVTIYTSYSYFSIGSTAYADACKTNNFTGYFTYAGVTYYYINGSGSTSSCSPPPTTPPPPTPPPPTPPPPTPPPPTPPTPTPTPTPMPTYTNPQILRSDIHASYETGSGTWQVYKSNINYLFTANSGTNQSDYRDHVIREFNRKISILNQPTGLFIAPYDNGFRFTGV